MKRPKLDGFAEIIDGWLEGDVGINRKQRHTAKRLFERLFDEHGFTGGYTIAKDYMRQRERRGREMFVPLTHPPGHAQADFGEATVIIGGIEQKAHFFVLDLPHSDACYVRAYPAATAAASPWLSDEDSPDQVPRSKGSVRIIGSVYKMNRMPGATTSMHPVSNSISGYEINSGCKSDRHASILHPCL